MKIPADIPAEVSEKIREYAVGILGLDGAGFARCDFFIDKRTDEIYLNEINTLQGIHFFQYVSAPVGKCGSAVFRDNRKDS